MDTSSEIVTLTSEQVAQAAIVSGTLEEKTLASSLRVNGTIEVPPQNLIAVGVPLGGYLRATPLLEGMRVRKGESIATLEDPQYIQVQQDYLLTQIRSSLLEKEYLRQKELQEKGAGSEKTFDNARAEYMTQQVMKAALEEKLRLAGITPGKISSENISRQIEIRSPITGFVSAVNSHIGKYVAPGEILFELVDPSDIHLTLTIFEKDLAALEPGMAVVSYSNHDTGKRYPARIIQVGRTLSSERAVQVHCHFDRYDPGLLPGMYMHAEIPVNAGSGWVIPEEGIVRFEGRHFVYEETAKNRYVPREIQPRVTAKGLTQLTFSGHNHTADMRYVQRGAYNILMKMKNREEE